VAKENRVIDWSGAKILDKEMHRFERHDNSGNLSTYARRSTVWTEMGESTTYLRPM